MIQYNIILLTNVRRATFGLIKQLLPTNLVKYIILRLTFQLCKSEINYIEYSMKPNFNVLFLL